MHKITFGVPFYVNFLAGPAPESPWNCFAPWSLTVAGGTDNPLALVMFDVRPKFSDRMSVHVKTKSVP